MRFKFSLGNLPALGKWVTLAIKLVVTALVVFYLYNSIEIDKLGLHLADSSKTHVAVAVFLTGILLVSLAFRWWTVCKISVVDIGFMSCFRLTFIGLFFNNFMLGSIGGDAVKCLLAARVSQSSTASVILSVFVDRLVGLTIPSVL